MVSRKTVGIIFILLSVIITLSLFILSKRDFSLVLKTPLLSLSQILSLFGTALLSISFMLSSKAKVLERLFGGLDSAYKIHHIVAGIAFIFLVNHPVLLIVNVLPNVNAALMYLFPGVNLSYNLGIFALWTMILLLILTIYIKLPYHIWKQAHEFMGIILLLGMLHVFLITSDVSRFLPLRIWMLSLLLVALFSFLYVRFLQRMLGPKYEYYIEKTNRMGDIIELYMKPVKRPMEFIPGQFAFIKIKAKGISGEIHPFSISSGIRNEYLRFSIKILGDYTLTLRDLQPGSTATIWGSYGGFPAKFFSNTDVICIAGGIGVTPFLGMLDTEVQRSEQNRSVYFFYTAKNINELYYHYEVISLTQQCNRVKYIPHLSAEKGRLHVKAIYDIVGDFKNKLIYLCGPYGMMQDLSQQFLHMGVKNSQIIFEDFQFK